MKIGFDTAKLSPTTICGYLTAVGAALLFGWKAALPVTVVEPSWCLTVGAILTLVGPITMGHGAADSKDVPNAQAKSSVPASGNLPIK